MKEGTTKQFEQQSSKKEQPILEDEVNVEKIQRRFVELPSERIELFANHLARPDGFAKMLILGSIVTSEELQRRIGDEFVKTHRGYYMSMPPSHYEGENDYLSFNVGRPQRLYQESSTEKKARDWKGGLGFIIPVKELLEHDNVSPSWGGFSLYSAVQFLKESDLSEPSFKKYYNISEDEARRLDFNPPKKDFLTLVHIARKSGMLDRGTGDQAEINIEKENDEFPQFTLDKGIILIPKKAKQAFARYLDSKIKQIEPYRDKIQKVFGIEVQKLNAEQVLEQYSNIYWYPQENIDLAVKCLSIDPNSAGRFLKKNVSKKKEN